MSTRVIERRIAGSREQTLRPVRSGPAFVMAASRAKAWFARKPKRLDSLGAGGGVLMIGLGATMATASHGA